MFCGGTIKNTCKLFVDSLLSACSSPISENRPFISIRMHSQHHMLKKLTKKTPMPNKTTTKKLTRYWFSLWLLPKSLKNPKQTNNNNINLTPQEHKKHAEVSPRTPRTFVVLNVPQTQSDICLALCMPAALCSEEHWGESTLKATMMSPLWSLLCCVVPYFWPGVTEGRPECLPAHCQEEQRPASVN